MFRSLLSHGFLTIALLIGLNSYADRYVAVNAAPALWSNPTTWDLGTVPTALDTAVIPSGKTVILAITALKIMGLEIETGGVLQASGFVFNVAGWIILDGQLDGASAIMLGAPGITASLSGSGFFSNTNLLAIRGDLNILSNSDLSMIGGDFFLVDNAGPDPVVTNNGTISLGPANLSSQGSDGMFINRGTLNSASEIFQAYGGKGKLDASSPGNTVNYYQAGNQYIVEPVSTYYHLKIGTSGTKTSDHDITIDGDLTIEGSAQYDPMGKVIYLSGHWNNTSTHADPFLETGTIIYIQGSQPQDINTAALETLDNVRMVNTSSTGVTLKGPVHINSQLELLDGILYTSLSSMLTVLNGASTISSNVSFVDGPMEKVGNSGFVFPVGDDNHYARIEISSPANVTDTYRAEYIGDPTINPGSKGAGLNNVSVLEYWRLEEISGSNALEVTIYWEDGTKSDINDLNDLTVSNYDATLSKWLDLGRGSVSGNLAAGKIEGNISMIDYSYVTFGSSSGSVNPLGAGTILPIELISLNAVKDHQQINVQWVTAVEVNCDHFTVERSVDGEHFEPIARVKGAGNKSSVSQYLYVDEQPLYGMSYYRLRQTDFDGNFSYTETVTARFDILPAATSGIKIFPNPVVSGEQFHISLPDGSFEAGEEVLIVLADINGREVFSKVIVFEKNGVHIAVDVNNQLNPGIYVAIASNDDQIRFNDRLMVLRQ